MWTPTRSPTTCTSWFALSWRRHCGGQAEGGRPSRAWDAKWKSTWASARRRADGVLQDVHWSAASRLLPTYSLGNLLAAQFYHQAVSNLPGIPAQIEQGEFASLFNWMRENIHNPGCTYTPTELVKKVTGGQIRTEPFLTYIRAKYTDLYDL